jgi:hypothetical protein
MNNWPAICQTCLYLNKGKDESPCKGAKWNVEKHTCEEKVEK